MIDLRPMLASGPQLGLCITYPAAGMIERIGQGWDWIWVDGQHGQLDYRDMLAAVRAADLVGKPSVVRVAGHDAGTIGRALDMLPGGVMVPLVDSEDQARCIVQAAKFPPLGSRSFGGRRPIDLLGRTYVHPDQPQPLLICQIETPSGLEHVEEIAAVDGVDVVFFGPDDMALRAGLPMDRPRPVGYFDDAFRRVAAAATSNGKFAGSVLPTPEMLRFGIQCGYRLIVAGADMTMLSTASDEKLHVSRGIVSECSRA